VVRSSEHTVCDAAFDEELEDEVELHTDYSALVPPGGISHLRVVCVVTFPYFLCALWAMLHAKNVSLAQHGKGCFS